MLALKSCCLVAFLISRVLASDNILTLPAISPVPSNASELLDRWLASFSFELAYLPYFTGNRSNPNVLTQELMQRLVERTGVGPDIRPGGITVQEEYTGQLSTLSTFPMTIHRSIHTCFSGPGFFNLLKMFPDSSRFIVDTNLGNNSVDIAQHQVEAAVKYLGWDRIYTIQLGNEPDHYAGGSRPSNWSSAAYTAQFLNWTTTLTERLSLPPRIFQAPAVADDPTPSALITTISTVDEGIDSTGVLKLFDQHTYQYSTCDPERNAIATLPNLINHRNITAYLDLWKPQISAARARGKEFVVGEYSSVSCSGKQNVTDTFGQALWIADTVLYGAFLNISRMYLHQGATLVFQSSQQANEPGFSWYDLWYPVETERYGPARASPSFVAYLLINEVVGSSQQSRLSLIDVPSHPQLAAYAIWDPSARKDNIARFVLLNLSVRNESTSAADAALDEVVVDLSSYVRGGKGKSGAKVKRMTSPGLDSKDVSRVLWAGQSYENGTASGEEVIENLEDGKVTVQGSEGVLVFF
ncbi:uncharacterized protein FOMMEDRAFT_77371 [Fomitiporia mediterranea MF3/22]|uniref:uncharacterized protein n=1 Tax=Fomitiporia mediterranea (strain MF3/22) TaxID=694068 RepID=UPI0004407C8F|nr:uncharacterized protein FOMMEDRAFT_77371 [Fomitiporia mediterranea MF3/22]EJD07106.1 hypothetical protein FOMMEDRAFT_77371 [Fomitiporia mediterranea MF3/22]